MATVTPTGDGKMNAATTQERNAIIAFLEYQGRAFNALDNLTAYLDDHLGANPDTLNWGNVGDMGHIADRLELLVGEIGAGR